MGTPVTIPVEIGGRHLSLSFKFGTIRMVEAELGRPITEELMQGTMGLDMLSALFWAVLQPSLAITRAGSDDLIDEAGVETVSQWIAQGLVRYFGTDVAPDPADAAAAEGNDPAPKGKKTKGQ